MDTDANLTCLAELTAEIQELNSKLERLKIAADVLREKTRDAISNQVQATAAAVSNIRDSVATRQINAVRFSKLKQIVAAEWALEEFDGPRSAAEIVDRMIEGGFPADDHKKLRNAIFTGMTRKPSVFRKVERGLWDLVSRNGQHSGA